MMAVEVHEETSLFISDSAIVLRDHRNDLIIHLSASWKFITMPMMLPGSRWFEVMLGTG